MSTTLIATLGILFLLVLMLLGMPISISMLFASFVGCSFMIGGGSASSLAASTIWSSFSNYGWMVIPMFVLMGTISFRSGITEILYKTAFAWVGSFKGGLASTTILTSAMFAAICGSNTATSATIGTMALPEMKKYDYNPSFSGGAIAVGGTLGVIIPPSILLIIVAIQTQQPLGDLFIASLTPGIILTILFLLSVSILCLINPELGPAGPSTTWTEKLMSLGGIIETILLFIIVIGGLYAGWFTPTEAGSAGAAGALLVTLLRGRMDFESFTRAVRDALKVSSMVVLLLAGAVYFSKFMSLTRVPYNLANWAAELPIPGWGILLVILGIYLLGGCITDALGFLVVTIPIFFPVAEQLGFDIMWFSILVSVVTTLGAITPPVGINVYIVSGLDDDIDTQNIFKGIIPYVLSFLITIALMMVFPEIVLFLPEYLAG